MRRGDPPYDWAICDFCKHIVPGHYDDCPKLQEKPQECAFCQAVYPGHYLGCPQLNLPPGESTYKLGRFNPAVQNPVPWRYMYVIFNSWKNLQRFWDRIEGSNISAHVVGYSLKVTERSTNYIVDVAYDPAITRKIWKIIKAHKGKILHKTISNPLPTLAEAAAIWQRLGGDVTQITKHEYYRLLHKHHPDRGGRTGDAQDLTVAWNVLSRGTSGAGPFSSSWYGSGSSGSGSGSSEYWWGPGGGAKKASQKSYKAKKEKYYETVQRLANEFFANAGVRVSWIGGRSVSGFGSDAIAVAVVASGDKDFARSAIGVSSLQAHLATNGAPFVHDVKVGSYRNSIAYVIFGREAAYQSFRGSRPRERTYSRAEEAPPGGFRPPDPFWPGTGPSAGSSARPSSSSGPGQRFQITFRSPYDATIFADILKTGYAAGPPQLFDPGQILASSRTNNVVTVLVAPAVAQTLKDLAIRLGGIIA